MTRIKIILFFSAHGFCFFFFFPSCCRRRWVGLGCERQQAGLLNDFAASKHNDQPRVNGTWPEASPQDLQARAAPLYLQLTSGSNKLEETTVLPSRFTPFSNKYLLLSSLAFRSQAFRFMTSTAFLFLFFFFFETQPWFRNLEPDPSWRPAIVERGQTFPWLWFRTTGPRVVDLCWLILEQLEVVMRLCSESISRIILLYLLLIQSVLWKYSHENDMFLWGSLPRPFWQHWCIFAANSSQGKIIFVQTADWTPVFSDTVQISRRVKVDFTQLQPYRSSPDPDIYNNNSDKLIIKNNLKDDMRQRTGDQLS